MEQLGDVIVKQTREVANAHTSLAAFIRQHGSDVIRASFATALGVEMEDIKKMKRELVESKLGKLECEGVTGTMTPPADPNNPVSRMSTFEVRLHDKAPFGVVTRQWHLKVFRNNNLSFAMTSISRLIDFGTGAKSELPDKGYEPKEDEETDSANVFDPERKAETTLKKLGVNIFRNDDGKVVAFDFPLPPRSRRGLPGQLTSDDLAHVTKLNWSKTRSTHKTRSGIQRLSPLWMCGR